MLIYLNKQPPKRRKAPKSPRAIRAVNEALRWSEYRRIRRPPPPPVAFPLTLPILQIKYIYFVLFPCYDGLNKDEKVILWRKSWHI